VNGETASWKLINILDSMEDGVYIVDQSINRYELIEKEYGPVKDVSVVNILKAKKGKWQKSGSL
jgi:hypothetical protein